jgi:hypothetical protein
VGVRLGHDPSLGGSDEILQDRGEPLREGGHELGSVLGDHLGGHPLSGGEGGAVAGIAYCGPRARVSVLPTWC